MGSHAAPPFPKRLVTGGSSPPIPIQSQLTGVTAIAAATLEHPRRNFVTPETPAVNMCSSTMVRTIAFFLLRPRPFPFFNVVEGQRCHRIHDQANLFLLFGPLLPNGDRIVINNGRNDSYCILSLEGCQVEVQACSCCQLFRTSHLDPLTSAYMVNEHCSSFEDEPFMNISTHLPVPWLVAIVATGLALCANGTTLFWKKPQGLNFFSPREVQLASESTDSNQ